MHFLFEPTGKAQKNGLEIEIAVLSMFTSSKPYGPTNPEAQPVLGLVGVTAAVRGAVGAGLKSCHVVGHDFSYHVIMTVHMIYRSLQ